MTQVVNSHHHFDHSGGIRGAVAEGLTVVAHKASAPFFQEAVARAHHCARRFSQESQTVEDRDSR
ncbi:MAG: hypothetical protein HYU27_05255 [Acidobacteria bacterium]|nr:hypothetical protein [Acidobacteriota bacterium]